MNAFLNRHNNGPPLTGISDVTARSISLSQENDTPKHLIAIFIPASNISVAEPYGVQVAELGVNNFTMHQFIGDINGAKVNVLESLLN